MRLGQNDKGSECGPKRYSNRKRVMSAVVEAQGLFREAFPPRRLGKLDNVFYQASRFISPRVTKQFTIRRARSIYEGTARRIDSEEMDALREALVEEARREKQELRARLVALDEKIAAFDAVTSGKALAADRQHPGHVG